MQWLFIPVAKNNEAIKAGYDKLRVSRSSTESGSYTQFEELDLGPTRTVYHAFDPDGDDTTWYKYTFHSTSGSPADKDSDPWQGYTPADKIGWSFGTYEPLPGYWGQILTPDDIRYHFMWGIDANANDIAQSEFTDDQFRHFIDDGLADFESFLTIDIRGRIYKTKPDSTLIKGSEVAPGVDYTDEEDPYEFDPKEWQNYGFKQLRHYPVQSVERMDLYSPIQGKVMALRDENWVRLKKSVGQVHAFPTEGFNYGPYQIAGMPWMLLGTRYPDGLEVDYTTGYPSARYVPTELRSVIGMWVTIKALDTIGDGLLAGFSSQSVSLDGLSESFSSTQSATSAYFGARIKSYAEKIEDWYKKNRYKFGPVPMSFVGV